MPLYEYRCHQCGKTFEVLQKFSDEPLAVHEDCGGEVERLVSPPAFQFKGSGWYVTDYARNGKSAAAGANGKSETKEGKTETKFEPPKSGEVKAPPSVTSSSEK
jgi:putative FmdB family regulatory protein